MDCLWIPNIRRLPNATLNNEMTSYETRRPHTSMANKVFTKFTSKECTCVDVFSREDVILVSDISYVHLLFTANLIKVYVENSQMCNMQ